MDACEEPRRRDGGPLVANSSGYIMVYNPATRGVPTGAHVAAWRKHFGDIPEGMVVDHRCNNRRCVNPAHLQLLTQAENCRRSRLAKLTHADVAAIRASAEPYKVLAQRYGVSPGHVGVVRRREQWADV
jgi:hypothetical protein